MSDAGVMEPDEGEALAAEYVLGLLEGQELKAAEARLSSEPAFAREVATWWDRLAPLLDERPGREPRTDLWPRIEAAIGPAGAAKARDRLEPKPAVEPTRGAPAQYEPKPRRKRESRPDGARRGGAGRLVAAALAGAIAASAATVGVMVYRDRLAAPAQPTGPVMVATLNPEAGEALYVATFDRERRRMVVAPTRVLPSEGHAHELWIIPEGGEPVAAGVLNAGPSAMELEGELLRIAQAGATLAVTLEPPGGAPEGKPTGPVIASGALTVVG
jgi:anti-sigma-K factor RskA